LGKAKQKKKKKKGSIKCVLGGEFVPRGTTWKGGGGGRPNAINKLEGGVQRETDRGK